MLHNALIERAEHFDTGRSGADHGFGDPDEEAMLDGARDGGKPVRKFVRAGNGAEEAIDNKISIVADERFSAGHATQAKFTLAAAGFCRRRNHPLGRFEAEHDDFDGQGTFSKRGHGF